MLVDLRSNWENRPPPSDRLRRLSTAGVIAAWFVITCTPVFATVGVQNGAPAPQPKPQNVQPISLWPQPDWPSQQTSKLVQPGQGEATQVQRLKFSQAPIPLWPQPEWASQTTRKVVQPGQGEATRVLFERLALQPAWQWPQGEWASQSTRKTPIPDAVVAAQNPFTLHFESILAHWGTPPVTPIWHTVGLQNEVVTAQNILPRPVPQWPELSWDAQTTRKVVQAGQGEASQVQRLKLSNAPVWLWPQAEWESQATKKTPIPDAAGVVQNPFVLPFSKIISLWPQPEWMSQRVRTQVQPAPIDNPPFGQRLWLMPIVRLWEPGPLDPIIRRVVVTPGVPIPNLGLLFYDVETGVWYLRLNATTHEIIRIT